MSSRWFYASAVIIPVEGPLLPLRGATLSCCVFNVAPTWGVSLGVFLYRERRKSEGKSYAFPPLITKKARKLGFSHLFFETALFVTEEVKAPDIFSPSKILPVYIVLQLRVPLPVPCKVRLGPSAWPSGAVLCGLLFLPFL